MVLGEDLDVLDPIGAVELLNFEQENKGVLSCN